jgi:hypothetical protein
MVIGALLLCCASLASAAGVCPEDYFSDQFDRRLAEAGLVLGVPTLLLR